MTKTSHRLITNSLEELKAVDTKILSLKDISSFTDIMIITSGTSSRHMSAISDKIQENLRKNPSQLSQWKEKVQANGYY